MNFQAGSVCTSILQVQIAQILSILGTVMGCVFMVLFTENKLILPQIRRKNTIFISKKGCLALPFNLFSPGEFFLLIQYR